MSREEQFLTGLQIYILPVCIIKARRDIFKSQIKKYGGTFCDKFCDNVTHIIVDENLTKEKFCHHFGNGLDLNYENVRVVRSLWLSKCLREKKLAPVEDFVFQEVYATNEKDSLGEEGQGQKVKVHTDGEGHSRVECQGHNDKVKQTVVVLTKNEKDDNPTPSTSGIKRKRKISPAIGHNESSDEETDYPDPKDFPKKKIPKGNWVCAASSSTQKDENHNKLITEKLQELAKVYSNTNDKWRALGYQKAIAALKKHPKPITTWEEAKVLPGVGTRLADKIWEIIESGELRKLEELSSSDEITAINLFTDVWGAGPKTAQQWVDQGFRTLDDLRSKAKLTRQQKIGLRLYEDLLERMPREEAADIEDAVKEAVSTIDPGLIAMACGSYRRGKVTCGDVDVLITHPDGKSHRGVFQKLLEKLRDTGFLTDDLVTHEDNGDQKKYLGVCKLPGNNRKHRRLDIIVVPYREFGCALMYFTGSAHFNRSMRNMASKMGMSLNEHALSAGVVRKNGEKIHKGVPLHTPTEESVFESLGLTYRQPEERDH